MYRSVIIVDDFYPEPERVRAAALALDYPPPRPGQNHAGRNSATRLIVTGVDEAVSEIVGEPLVGNTRVAHGRCRLAFAGDEGRFNVHVDEDTVWAGIVYLNLPEHCRGGTVLFRHRPSASDRAPITPEELKRFGVARPEDAVARVLEDDANDPEKWQEMTTLPMRFNRLVLIRPWFWHSAGPSFGDSPETARLIQLFFFVHPPESAPAAHP